jgi:tetratricopeptide (TPR) repeat protein
MSDSNPRHPPAEPGGLASLAAERWRRVGQPHLLLHAARWRSDPAQPERAIDAALGRGIRLRRGSGQDALKLRAEAEILARLDHPVIPPLLEFGYDASGVALLATAPAEGDPLACSERQPKPSALPRSLRALRDVADALAHAHERGVQRGSLSPTDVLLGTHGETWLVGWEDASMNDAPPLADIAALRELLGEILAGGGPRELRALSRVAAPWVGSARAFADELERYLAGEPLLSHRYGRRELLARWLRARPLVPILMGIVALAVLALGLPLGLLSARLERSRAQAAEAEARGAQAEGLRARAADSRQRSVAAEAETKQLLSAAGHARAAIHRRLARAQLEKPLALLLAAKDASIRLEGARLLVLARWEERARPLLAALSKEPDLALAAEASLLSHVIEVDRGGATWPDAPRLRELCAATPDAPALATYRPYARALKHLEDGDRVAAYDSLRGYRAPTRWHYPGLLLRARLGRMLGRDLEAAQEDANQATLLAPEPYRVPGHMERSWIFDLQGKVVSARRARLWAIEASSAASLAHHGLQATQSGRAEDGVRLLSEALKLDPRLIYLKVSLAEALFRSERAREAVELLGLVVLEVPFPYQAHLSLAEQHLIDEELDQAQEQIRRALALSPRVPRAYYLRGQLRTLRRDRSGAIEDFERCLKLDPQAGLRRRVEQDLAGLR